VPVGVALGRRLHVTVAVNVTFWPAWRVQVLAKPRMAILGSTHCPRTDCRCRRCSHVAEVVDGDGWTPTVRLAVLGWRGRVVEVDGDGAPPSRRSWRCRSEPARRVGRPEIQAVKVTFWPRTTVERRTHVTTRSTPVFWTREAVPVSGRDAVGGP